MPPDLGLQEPQTSGTQTPQLRDRTWLTLLSIPCGTHSKHQAALFSKQYNSMEKGRSLYTAGQGYSLLSKYPTTVTVTTVTSSTDQGHSSKGKGKIGCSSKCQGTVPQGRPQLKVPRTRQPHHKTGLQQQGLRPHTLGDSTLQVEERMCVQSRGGGSIKQSQVRVRGSIKTNISHMFKF